MPDRWMTYEEAGALFGLSAEAMRKRARRLHWVVQPPNDTQGKARIKVPESAELRPAGPLPGRPPGDRPDNRPDSLVVELRQRAERAEASEAAFAAEIIQERERRALAEGKAAGLQVAFDQLLGRADRDAARVVELTGELATERGQATAMANAARLVQARALAAEAEAAGYRDAMERAGAQAATERAAREAAERDREAARGELAELTAGGPLRRALRAFAFRRGRP